MRRNTVVKGKILFYVFVSFPKTDVLNIIHKLIGRRYFKRLHVLHDVQKPICFEPKFPFRIRPLWRPTLFLPKIGWESPILAEVYFYCSPQGLDDQRLLMLKKRMGKGQSERTKVKANFLLHPYSPCRHSKGTLLRSVLTWIWRCVCQLVLLNCFELNFRFREGRRQSLILIYMNFGGACCPMMDDGFDLIHEKIEDQHHSDIEKEWIFLEGPLLPTASQC